ncbi:MAG TPA: AAA family ATPase [Spirochaetota bacterium]|nr:AAA family ATPase [Spirochaetota bacterium]HPI90455.1 AAA family ATPase [Spirochaetota bacterium]HPR49364.1 AAA family ATPase [Spirochaetota bacterium]
MNDTGTIVFAVCGKGGVGKTTVSAALTRFLGADEEKTVLAIDADPAIGLATALGFTGSKTVDGIRLELIDGLERGQTGAKEDLAQQLDYDVFAAIEERENLSFLAIGRPEKEGCYCKVNSLLRDIIGSIAANYDYVVIDGEAGIEQVNRRVMERVSHLIVVSDLSAKGIGVAETIAAVSADAVHFEKAGLIINRVRDDHELSMVRLPAGLPVLGWLPESDNVRTTDMRGGNIYDINDVALFERLRACLQGLGI